MEPNATTVERILWYAEHDITKAEALIAIANQLEEAAECNLYFEDPENA